jgi:hypothetical protein
MASAICNDSSKEKLGKLLLIPPRFADFFAAVLVFFTLGALACFEDDVACFTGLVGAGGTAADGGILSTPLVWEDSDTSVTAMLLYSLSLKFSITG